MSTIDKILAARAHPHDVKAATRPTIQLRDPNVLSAIHVALCAIKADIVCDDDNCLVATYDGGHFHRLDNWARRCDCLAWFLQFMKGDRRVDPPSKLANEFFSHARELGWFKHEHRGPCPACAAKNK